MTTEIGQRKQRLDGRAQEPGVVAAVSEELAAYQEQRRLAAVRHYSILDTPPDGAFDRVATLAARAFQAKLATVTIVDEDRIWFKAAEGVEGVSEIAREPGLCASAILQDEPYVLPDTLRHAQAATNPLVRGELGLRFYAAAPITTAEGYRLGTVNVMDTITREISENETNTLRDLAAVVMDALELRLATMRTVRHEQEKRRDQEANLRVALDSHATIDQAIGMIMASHRCDVPTAWGILQRLSQHTNTKLRTIAEAMADFAVGGDATALSETTRRAVRHAMASPGHHRNG